MSLTLGTWFSQENAFLPGDLVIGLVGLVKAMDVVWTFLVGGYTRVVSVICCISSPAALHLLQNCLDLASMPYVGEVGEVLQVEVTVEVPEPSDEVFIGGVCCMPEHPVCSDIQLAWMVLCSNCDLIR